MKKHLLYGAVIGNKLFTIEEIAGTFEFRKTYLEDNYNFITIQRTSDTVKALSWTKDILKLKAYQNKN